MGKVLVLDAQLRSSLAVIRSLGKTGLEVTAGSESRSGIGLYSKYTATKIIYPNPRASPDIFLQWLRNLVQKKSYDCIIPSHTYTVFLLTKYRDLLEPYTKIPPPDFKIFFTAYDKQRLFEVAAKHQIPIPLTYDPESLDTLIGRIQRYPVVVKPARRHSLGIAVCQSPYELRESYKHFTSLYGPCVVQDYIPNGGEFGVYTLFNERSEPVALTVQQRIRTLHDYGGFSTSRRTVENEELVRIAFQLLRLLRWSGVAMVEFRVDKNTGQPKVIEINPRLWGSLQLAIEAGVDFPHLLYRFTVGEKLTPALNYEKNVECRWLLGDVAGFLRCHNKIRELQSFLNPTIHSDILSYDDLKPTLFSLFTLSNTSEKEPRKDEPSMLGWKSNENFTHLPQGEESTS